MNEQVVLEISQVSKRFGKLSANENISLTLQQGEIIALLGENGAGKTTLMNILFGHYRADQGSIRVFGQSLSNHSPEDALQAGIGMVHQHFTLAENLTVLDNIMLGTEPLWSPISHRRKARKLLHDIASDAGLEVALDSKVRELTVGQRQRVEILKALYRNVRILILDEPTAVLTPQEVDDLFTLLRRMVEGGLSIIIISHKLQEVLSISDRVVVLRHGRVVGEASTDNVDRDQLAEMIVGRQIERPTAIPRVAGKNLLSLQRVSVHGSRSSRPLLDDVSLNVPASQITGIAGVSGNGQSVLADVLSGMRRIDSGEWLIDGHAVSTPTPKQLTTLGFARIPEDRHTHGVVGEMNLWENLMLDEIGNPPRWRAGLTLNRDAARTTAEGLVKQFDIRCSSTEQPAALLSGGNMQKLILARNLARKPRLILANQPTRGLDEGAIAAVHALLIEARDRGAGILLITEDLDELLRLADNVVVMHAGTLSEPLPANNLSQRELGLRMAGSH
ncbi:MAG: ABC transporter ATP-binding protein [Granulosicoccus sp.]